MHPVSEKLASHYAEKIKEFGPTAKGVDWGKEGDVDLRYLNMLRVLPDAPRSEPVSLLDVGCGYGGLLTFAQKNGVALDYTGIDIVENSIDHARALHPSAEFILGDVLDTAVIAPGSYDYVVCSGVLTLKSSTSIKAMDEFFRAVVGRMFAIARLGIAFNTMTNVVNFFDSKLYYRSPVETLAYCLSELSDRVRIDHAYDLFEFTAYVYKPERR